MKTNHHFESFMTKYVLACIVGLLAFLLFPFQLSATNVRINVTGDVILPNYVSDPNFSKADLYLYGDAGQLAHLNIYSDDYYDPTDCYYNYIHCDTCGLAYLGNGYGYVDIECGKTYDLTLSGQPCQIGLTASFSSSYLPPGHILEWKDVSSGAVVDNKTSQKLTSGTFKEWKVTLKPKRIHFTKESLSSDGLDQTQAKLSFLVGTGGWFTQNPVWSIEGDTLGCTIDASTGWIRAGTEAGEITVLATDASGTGHFLSGALKIGCQSCASGSCGLGAGVCANLRNALSVSLGVLPCDNSYIGSIRLKLTSPSTTLATPAGLTYDQFSTDNALPEILTVNLQNDNSSPVRQVLAPQCLADIVAVSGTEYEIRFYSPENRGSKDGSGYYVPSGTPFKVWRVISLATDGGGNTTQFSVTEDPDGVNIVNTFTWNATDNAWILSRTNLRQEEKINVTGLPPEAPRETSRRTETTQISTPGNPNIVSKVTKTYANLSLAGGTVPRQDILVEERVDGHKADGSAANPDEVTDYYYADTVTPDGHEELERVTHSDGSWEHYTYDANGRISDVYQPWLDSQPPASIDTAPSSVPNKRTHYDYTLLPGDTGDSITPRKIEVYADTTGGSPQLVSRSFTLLTTDTADYPQLDIRQDIECPNSTVAWNDGGNPITIARTFATGPNKGATQSIDRPDGTRTLYAYYQILELDGSSADDVQEVSEGAAGSGFSVTDGRKTTTTTTAKGIVISTVVTDILTGKQLVNDVWSGTADAKGRFPTLTHLDNTTETYSYDCCNTTQIIGRDGQTTVFTPDALNRIWSTTVYYSSGATPRIETQNTFDANGNITKTTRIGTDGSFGSSIVVVPLREYDRSGRVVREQNALLGYTTTTEGTTANGGREVTTYYSDGGTRIEDYYRDGRLAKVTGTSVQPVQYEYDVDTSSGETYAKVTKLDSAYNPTTEWTKTYTDFEGHDYKTVYPDNAYVQQFYAKNGQLWKERDPDGVLTVYIYNLRGGVEYTEQGMKTDPSSPPTAPDTSGAHRITQVDRSVGSYTDGSAYDTLVTRVTEWTTPNSGNTIVTSESHVSLDGLRQWAVAYPNDTFKQVTKSVTQYATGGSRTVVTTFPDNSYQISAFSYGRSASMTRYESGRGQVAGTTYQYDLHGRLWTSTDARNGSTRFGYNNADQVTITISPAPGDGSPAQARIIGYDTMGRPTQVTEPDRGIVYTRYYKNGLVKLTWGARTYPSGYEYDAQGRITKLHTWQSFTAPNPSDADPAFPSGYVTTTWNYDPNRGWLNNKRYPDNTGPDYTYTAGGRLKSRQWVRLVPNTSTRLTTTYTYDFDSGGASPDRMAGYLAGIDYNDSGVPTGEISTPGLTFDYDRRGRQTTVTQGTSSPITTALGWHPSGALDSESYSGSFLDTLSVNAVNVDNNLLRRQSLQVEKSGTAIAGTAVSYGYDTASRLQSLTSGGFSATYDYAPNSSLINTTTFKQSATARLTTTRQYDFLNRLQTITPTPSAASQPPLSRAYGYNSANQRTRRTDGDFSYWNYGYDTEGQLTSARHSWYDNSPVPGQQFQFGYDAIGNRLSSAEGGDANGNNLRQTGYTPNNLNQYSSLTPDRTVDIEGLALVQNGVPTTVTINGAAPDYRRGEYFWKTLTGSGSGPNWLNVNVVDGSSSISGNVYIPPQTESLGYDLDGNHTSDGRWVYKWDAENRLARMDTQVSAAAAGVPAKRVQYIYDYQGRMIRRQVFSGAYGGGTITWNSTPDTAAGSDLIFLYDGFQCVATLNPDQSLYQAYVWGLDESGMLSGAGGLVMFSTTTGTYFPTYDGNGNVTGLVNGSDGTLVARYEYGPFGNMFRMSGSIASVNRFRFSSKWQDDQSDLIYYGFRWYSSYNGRWLSRDPIVEQGGLNLFSFVENTPVTETDSTGLTILRFNYGTFIPAAYIIDPFGRRFAGDKRQIFLENGKHRTRQFVDVDTDTGSVSQFVDIGQTKLLDKNGKVIATGYSPKDSFHASLISSNFSKLVVKIEGNGFDPLAVVQATVIVPAGPVPIAIPVSIPPPGITYLVIIKIDLCSKKISWEGEHDGFPAHEFFVNHELEHGYLPEDIVWEKQLSLFGPPVFSSVEFQGSADYQ